MRRPTATLAAITRDSITNCPDVDPFLTDGRPLGSVHQLQESWKHQFWAAWFEPDPAERARFTRVLEAPAQALRDLAALHTRATGEVAPAYPPALLELLKQRVSVAYFPSADIVVRRARSGSALYAQRCLLRYIEAEEWHAKY